MIKRPPPTARFALPALLLAALAASGANAQNDPVPGRLVPGSSGTASAGVEGRVTEIAALPGDRVEVGQVLVRLGNARIESRARTAELDLQIAKLELSMNEIRRRMVEEDIQGGRKELELAEGQVADARRLAEQGQISPLQIQQGEMALEQMRRKLAEGKATLEAREHEMEAARANVLRVELEFERSKMDLDELSIRAPIDGTVAELDAMLGAWVRTGTAVVRIEEGLAFEGALPESRLLEVAPGAALRVEVVGAPGIVLPGVVERVGVAGGEVRIRARLERPQDLDARVGPGLTASARLGGS